MSEANRANVGNRAKRDFRKFGREVESRHERDGSPGASPGGRADQRGTRTIYNVADTERDNVSRPIRDRAALVTVVLGVALVVIPRILYPATSGPTGFAHEMYRVVTTLVGVWTVLAGGFAWQTGRPRLAGGALLMDLGFFAVLAPLFLPEGLFSFLGPLVDPGRVLVFVGLLGGIGTGMVGVAIVVQETAAHVAVRWVGATE